MSKNPAPEAAASAKSVKKPAPPKHLEVDVTLVCPGAWSAAGLVAMTFEDRLCGRVEVLNHGHLYHREAGRDLYPNKNQFEALVRGEQVKLGVAQWA